MWALDGGTAPQLLGDSAWRKGWLKGEACRKLLWRPPKELGEAQNSPTALPSWQKQRSLYCSVFSCLVEVKLVDFRQREEFVNFCNNDARPLC